MNAEIEMIQEFEYQHQLKKQLHAKFPKPLNLTKPIENTKRRTVHQIVSDMEKKFSVKEEKRLTIVPEITAEEREANEEQWRMIRLESKKKYVDSIVRKTSSQMLKPNDVYAGIRLKDESTRPTELIKFWCKELYAQNQGQNFLILGSTGCGKTFSAIAFLAEAGCGQSNLYTTAYELSQAIYRRQFDLQDKAMAVDNLILDELGSEPNGFKGQDFQSFLEHLFDQRCRLQKRTIILSNHTLEDIKNAYGERIVSRLKQTGKVYQSSEGDLRCT
jgi:DNA replication protein DnaC